MREQFEKLPKVHKKLKDLHPTIVWFCDQENKYASSFEGFQNMVIWLNGAWYAYQEVNATRRPELDSDTCSDIRNHVSPLTKVIDR